MSKTALATRPKESQPRRRLLVPNGDKPQRAVERGEFSTEEIEHALVAGGGYISFAARILGCRTSTLKRYLAQYPELEEIQQDIKVAKLDVTEMQLFKNIMAGDNTAIIFHLKTQGKARGYIETTSSMNLNLNPELDQATWKDLVKDFAKRQRDGA